MAATNEVKVNSGRVAPGLTGRRNEEERSAPLRPRRPAPETGKSWRFVLIVEPAPDAKPVPFVSEPVLVRLLGPGATLLEEPFEPTVKIRFDWPARTQAEAVVAGITAVEAAGLRVLRVDNDDWVTAADIAHRVGRSRETVRLWALGQMGPSGFPPPANPRRDTTFYSWAELLPWLRDRKGLDLPEEQPALVAADLVVRLRALLPRIPLSAVIVGLLDATMPGVSANARPELGNG